MNDMTRTAAKDLLKTAQYHPVFDEDGNIAGISQLRVDTDTRFGVRAMEELANSQEELDEVVLPTGFTRKQQRILNQAAPYACHYLKSSTRWNASSGQMEPRMVIQLPYEVLWTLFEKLFDGQFSFTVVTTDTQTEDIMPVSTQGQNGNSNDSAPGRIFYTHAQVRLTLHLGNGTTRNFDGFGVAYGDVRIQKMGNVYAVNSARRTAEKGAIIDAKRDAMSNIGRVFRRAFEDGDEMMAQLEGMLMDEIHSKATAVNVAPKPKAPVPPPASKKAKADPAPAQAPEQLQERDDWDEDGYVPLDQAEDQARSTQVPEEPKEESGAENEAQEAETAQSGFTLDVAGEKREFETADAFFDDLEQTMEALDEDKIIDFIKANAAGIDRAYADNPEVGMSSADFLVMNGVALDEVEAVSAEKASEDGIPDFDLPEAPAQEDWTLSVKRKTGKEILAAYDAAFAKAKTEKDLEAILDQNTDLAKRLSAKQGLSLIEMQAKAKKTLGS